MSSLPLLPREPRSLPDLLGRPRDLDGVPPVVGEVRLQARRDVQHVVPGARLARVHLCEECMSRFGANRPAADMMREFDFLVIERGFLEVKLRS